MNLPHPFGIDNKDRQFLSRLQYHIRRCIMSFLSLLKQKEGWLPIGWIVHNRSAHTLRNSSHNFYLMQKNPWCWNSVSKSTKEQATLDGISKLQQDCCHYIPVVIVSAHEVSTCACVVSVMTTAVLLATCAQLNRPWFASKIIMTITPVHFPSL